MQSEAMVPGNTEETEMIRLINTYSGMLLGMCTLILSDRDLAQDIVQETFVRAWQHKNQRENEKAWLIRVAVNLCHDYHRSRWWKNIEHRFSAEEVDIAVPSSTDQSDILELVRQLPYKEKESVILFFWNGLSADEIAHATGTSRASVYRRLDKAKKRLKLELEGGWHE